MTDTLPTGNKAATLAALFNASKQQGMGFLDRTGAVNMTESDAHAVILGYGEDLYFDYLKGRVLKVDLNGDEFNPSLYDRDNGQGAARRALEGLNQ